MKYRVTFYLRNSVDVPISSDVVRASNFVDALDRASQPEEGFGKVEILDVSRPCSCSGVSSKRTSYQETIAYSPHFKGLMIGCSEHPEGCGSQYEGEYPTEESAEKAIAYQVEFLFLDRRPAGSLDPKKRD